MTQNFLIKAVVLSLIAGSAFGVDTAAKVDTAVKTTVVEKQGKKSFKAKKSVKHARKSHNDAYSPKGSMHHVKAAEAPIATEVKKEEMVVFLENPKAVSHHEEKKFDDNIHVKVKGKVDLQYGYVDQTAFFQHPSNNANLPQSEKATDTNTNKMPATDISYGNKHAMTSAAEMHLLAEKDTANGKYGAAVEINANASPAASGSPNIANKVYLFVENNAGRFELGANDGASEAMAISATDIAKATGGIDGDATLWVPYGAVYSTDSTVLNDTFLQYPALPYAAQHSGKSNKITYYTPRFNGFKVGMSYVRDVNTRGTLYEALSFHKNGFKDVLEGGISYEQEVNNMKLALSATGQTGDTRDSYINATTTPVALEKLGAWEVGGKVTYDGFSLAASYSDWGKSGTDKAQTGKKEAYFWTAGAAYDQKDFGLSLTYMKSTRQGAFSIDSYDYISANTEAYYGAKQEYEAVSLGGEYHYMPGLTPYLEVTNLKFKTPLVDVKANNATVFLGGVKLNF